ncbi:MAG TPA: ABC transporter substrate-binding protein [Ktedonobacteraceae bacterium]|nr:ABC transporter substrate-binding protein [Ktedonobacteraceae bacterium]
MMRRYFASLVIVLALLLAACGSGSSSGSSNGGAATQGIASGNPYISCPSSTNTTAAAPVSGNVTLTVAGWTSTPAEDALVQSNLQKFEQLHPNIHITWSPIPGDYPTKMRANVAGGTVPDVFYLSPDMSSEYISASKLLNLSPYMARDHVSASNYYSALLNPFVCTGGQVYGLPKDWASLGVFYNKQMFQAAGVPFPSANWTWQDFQNDAAKLTKNAGSTNAVYGVSLSADASRWGAFLLANGGTMLNKNGTQATFNSQAGVSSLEYYDSFLKNHTGVLPTQVGAPWNGDAFGKAKAAMTIEGPWLIPYMQTTYPNIQYSIAPLPVAPTGKRANLIFTNAWSAYSGTKYPEAAWELIKYMTGTTVQKSQLDAGFALPTIKGLANDPYFTQHPDFKVLFDAATYGYADYYGPQDLAIHNDLATALQAVMLNKQTAQSALNDAATKVNNTLQGG